MNRKKKIMAIWVVLLLFAIPFSIAQASENIQNNDIATVEIATFLSNGITTTETIDLSGEDLAEFENTISILIERIQSATSWEEIENIFKNIPEPKGVILQLIFKILSKFIPFRNRAFVISHGHSYKLNPLRKNGFKIRQKFTLWHYTNGDRGKDKTIFFKPLSFKMKVLTGMQIGFMSRFTGIYIYISKNLPEKSYTFFMGTAARINGIQVLPS